MTGPVRQHVAQDDLTDMVDQPKVVGQPVAKFDALDKVLGRAEYVTDMSLPNMLHAKLVLSPHPHAKITRIDTAVARALPGVRGVVTFADVPRIAYNPRGTAGSMEDCAPLDKYILDDTVRYVGDLVAGVAAESENIAEEAALLIAVDYEALPAVFDPEEALRPSAPQVHPEISRRNLATADGKPIEYVVGDVEAGFKAADLVFEGTYLTGRQSHVCPEPSAAIASWDRFTGRLTITCTTQVPFQIQKTLAYALDLPPSHVRVIMTHMGAGFGSRQECTDMFPAVAALAILTGRPVRLVNTRPEEFLTRTRHASKVSLKTGVKKDGTITAMEARVVSDGGAYSSHSVPVNTCLMWMLTFYKCPNMHFEVLPVYTNTPVAGAFRGYGNPQARFATEVHTDEICDALGLDPIEYRLAHCRQSGDSFIPTVVDEAIISCGLKECLEKGRESIGWSRRNRLDYRGTAATRRGMGVAASFIWSGSGILDTDRGAAIVQLNADGTALLNTGVADLGTGAKSVLAQIAAEALGLRYEQVSTLNGMTVDTGVNLPDVGTYGSRSTYVAGGAVKAAAEDARQQLVGLAAEMLAAEVDDLEISDGSVYVKGSREQRLAVADVVERAGLARRGSTDIIGTSSYEPKQAPSYAACFAEVEVDTRTGQVRVLKIAAAHDAGRALNPAHCVGQIVGGVSMGLGYTFTEDLLVDSRTGCVLNNSLLDYKICSSADMPDVDPIIVEAADPTGPFGAKGLGELAVVTTAPAISNAIYDAIGVRMVELPITPSKVLTALGQRTQEGR